MIAQVNGTQLQGIAAWIPARNSSLGSPLRKKADDPAASPCERTAGSSLPVRKITRKFSNKFSGRLQWSRVSVQLDSFSPRRRQADPLSRR